MAQSLYRVKVEIIRVMRYTNAKIFRSENLYLTQVSIMKQYSRTETTMIGE